MKDPEDELIPKQGRRSWNYRPPSRLRLLGQRVVTLSKRHSERLPFILSGLFLIAVITIISATFFTANKDSPNEGQVAPKDEEVLTADIQAQLNHGKSAELAIEKFLTAPSLQARLNLTNLNLSNRHPRSFGPSALHEPQLFYRKIGNAILMEKGNTPLYFQEIAVQSNLLPLLLIKEGEQWKVDYEAFTGYNQSSWSQLENSDAHEAEVRVSLTRGITHGPNFEDKAKWLPYKLENPNWPLPLEGFVRRGSETALYLAQIRKGTSVFGKRAILLLRREKNNQERQFEIIQVIEKGWSKLPT